MHDAIDMPKDLESCWALIAAHTKTIDELSTELEKVRKLLSHFVHGNRSAKVLTDPKQAWLPFEDSKEFQEARAEAEAEAERIIQTYTVQREKQVGRPCLVDFSQIRITKS